MNLISNSMGNQWKLSFALCALFLVLMFFEGVFASHYVDEKRFMVGVIPMAIWLTSRWLSLKE